MSEGGRHRGLSILSESTRRFSKRLAWSLPCTPSIDVLIDVTNPYNDNQWKLCLCYVHDLRYKGDVMWFGPAEVQALVHGLPADVQLWKELTQLSNGMAFTRSRPSGAVIHVHPEWGGVVLSDREVGFLTCFMATDENLDDVLGLLRLALQEGPEMVKNGLAILRAQGDIGPPA